MYLSQFPSFATTEKLAHRLHCVIQLNFANITKYNLGQAKRQGKATTYLPISTS